jgi:hypothetical protein
LETDYNNFQRVGSLSNAHAGRDFEKIAQQFFVGQGVQLTRPFVIDIGVASLKKGYKFDLGAEDPATLVECKSHTWTRSEIMPSGKLTAWNEAMYYFHIAPRHYRKIFLFLESDS